MIYVRLHGGLGNQMFQYATGLSLAIARGTALRLDLSRLDEPCRTPRSFELGPFRIRAGIAEPGEMKEILEERPSLADRLLRRPGRIARERHFHYDPEVRDLPDGTCLQGYWQSERYFDEVKEQVRHDLTLEKPASGRNAELLEEIEACNSVSLHVRRGDYVSEPAAFAMHGVCSVDYYRRATARIAERVPDPVFFLFSDDPEWTRRHIALGNAAVVVDHNGAEGAAEDLRLMSRCAHHIVANSTFSWWGAWLDPKPDEIVIAPERWFQDATRDTSDLLPGGWTRL